jgi:hypothetical protein
MRKLGKAQRIRLLMTASTVAFGLALAAYWAESPVVNRVVHRASSGVASAAGARFAPRVAELLAFHEAQDRGDLRAMLQVAARLEAIGEPAVGRHVRAAAEWAVRVGWTEP